MDEFCKVLLFVDTNNKVCFFFLENKFFKKKHSFFKIHTYPSVPLSRALSTIIPTYIYLFDKTEQVFIGYYLSINENDQQSVSSKI